MKLLFLSCLVPMYPISWQKGAVFSLVINHEYQHLAESERSKSYVINISILQGILCNNLINAVSNT